MESGKTKPQPKQRKLEMARTILVFPHPDIFYRKIPIHLSCSAWTRTEEGREEQL